MPSTELGTPNDVGDMLGSDEAARLQAEQRYKRDGASLSDVFLVFPVNYEEIPPPTRNVAYRSAGPTASVSYTPRPRTTLLRVENMLCRRGYNTNRTIRP